MRARFLKKGEEKLWFDLMEEDSTELFTQAVDYRPESHVIVEKSDRVIGGMHLIIDEPHYLMLFNPKLEVDPALNPLLCKAIETAKSLHVEKVYCLIHGSNKRFKTIQRMLGESKFIFGMKKVLYEFKSSKLPDDEPNNALSFESLSVHSEPRFINIFKAVYQPDMFESDAEKCFVGMREEAVKTGRFYPQDWEIAYRGSEEIGITMPQLHDKGGEIGSNWYLGVIPAQRQRGFGRALQRRAINTLRQRCAKMIVGSTVVNNAPMIRVFQSLGYEFMEYQHFYTYSGVL